MRKSDNSRIVLAVGATIVNRIEDIRESDVGTGSGLFRVEKIGDECVFFLFLFYFWVLFLLLLLFFISPGLPCLCVCGFGFHLSTLAFFTSFFNFLFLFFGSILGDQCLRLFSLAIPLVLSFDIRACVRAYLHTHRAILVFVDLDLDVRVVFSFLFCSIFPSVRDMLLSLPFVRSAPADPPCLALSVPFLSSVIWY